MVRWLVCLCVLIAGCAPSAPTSGVPTPVGGVAKSGGGAATAVAATNRPSEPTVSAAATRLAQATPADAPLAVVNWFMTSYRAGRAVEPLAMLTPDYSDQLRLTGGIRSALGAGPEQIRAVDLRLQPGGTPDKTMVEAIIKLAEGETILNLTLTQTPQGWRITRIETTG